MEKRNYLVIIKGKDTGVELLHLKDTTIQRILKLKLIQDKTIHQITLMAK